MFDIGFAEILAVSVVGLLVIGPEQLPSTIRTASLWLGRARRTFQNIRDDIEKEIGAEEIASHLKEAAECDPLGKRIAGNASVTSDAQQQDEVSYESVVSSFSSYSSTDSDREAVQQ